MAARERLDLWCERGIQGLVLAILCFGPMAFGAVDEAPFAIIEVLAAFIGLLWAARFFLNPELKLLWPPVCWAVLAFALYTLWRYRIADIEYVARGEFAHVGVYAFLFLAIVNNLHRQEVTQFVVCAVITLAMLIAGYALYQFVTGSNRVWNVYSPYAHRGTGTYINPNHLGGFLEMVFPLALAFTLLSRFKALPRVLLGYAALVILAGIAVTISRGSWISTALALLLFLFVLLMNRAYRLPALAVLIVVAAGSVFLVQRSHIVQKRAGQLVVNGRIDDDRRFALWKPTIQMWRANFWWGAGPGHFDYRFREYRPESVQLQPDHAHNDYLNTLADYGIAGSALVAAALALLAAGVFVTWRKVRPSEGDLGGRSGSNKFALVCGASMGLAAILFHSAVDFNLHIPANAILA
ncbi:MAG TPA: O-antigen ligase family protein, partial [Verrucomicrobiae bacterium]|nr:O-antigen ligase family protein [Verrucomicrobiae bacterium]